MEIIPTGKFAGVAVSELHTTDLRELLTTTRFHLPPELLREIESERARRRERRRRGVARRTKNHAAVAGISPQTADESSRGL